MRDYLDFFYLAIYPETILNLVIVSLIFIISTITFLIAFKLVDRKITNLFIIILRLIGICIIYFVVQLNLMPYIESFNDNKTNILIANFTGVDLVENFGELKFNEALKKQIGTRFRMLSSNVENLNFDNIFNIKTTSWKIRDIEEANDLREKFNSHIIIWGSLNKIDNSIICPTNINTGALALKIVLGNSEKINIIVPLDILLDAGFIITDEKINSFETYISNVVNEILPLIYFNIVQFEQKKALDIVRAIPKIQNNFQDNDLNGLILFSAAQILETKKDTLEAIKYYDLSYEYLHTLIEKIHNGYEINLPANELSKIATISKIHSAYLNLNKKNILKAKESAVNSAFHADESLIPTVKQLFQSCELEYIVTDSGSLYIKNK